MPKNTEWSAHHCSPYQTWVLKVDGARVGVVYSDRDGCWSRLDGAEAVRHPNMPTAKAALAV
jgi:hypothetical protein